MLCIYIYINEFRLYRWYEWEVFEVQIVKISFVGDMRGVTCTFDNRYICGYESDPAGSQSSYWIREQGTAFSSHRVCT